MEEADIRKVLQTHGFSEAKVRHGEVVAAGFSIFIVNDEYWAVDYKALPDQYQTDRRPVLDAYVEALMRLPAYCFVCDDASCATKLSHRHVCVYSS